MHPYFAYGSNLDPAQMALRCPDACVVSRATLRRHRLVFPRPCSDWGGGVAGLEPARGCEVEGVLYLVSDADLAALDLYEAVAAGEYERRRVVVETAAGPFDAWTYFAVPIPAPPGRRRTPGTPATPGAPGTHAPSRRYLDAILRGARHHGLPGAYVERLARIAPCDEG